MPQQEPLPPDPESVEKWQNLPHNTPSKQALPPLFGGAQMTARLTGAFLIVIVILTVVGLIFGSRPL
ncbi:MAG: hypothetical protein GYB67_15265 [Chloroflexi bacterium]|nr:hypothetical protein [Chloroflexota bacterium]